MAQPTHPPFDPVPDAPTEAEEAEADTEAAAERTPPDEPTFTDGPAFADVDSDDG